MMSPKLLPVVHSLQEVDSGCLAACGQMSLRYLGINVSQRQLNRLLDQGELGALFSNIQRLARHRVHVALNVGDDVVLKSAIDNNQPPIIPVLTKELTTYWDINVRHALLVVGYDDTHFYLNDPAFADAPKRVMVDELMLAWLEFDYIYALITR